MSCRNLGSRLGHFEVAIGLKLAQKLSGCLRQEAIAQSWQQERQETEQERAGKRADLPPGFPVRFSYMRLPEHTIRQVTPTATSLAASFQHHVLLYVPRCTLCNTGRTASANTEHEESDSFFGTAGKNGRPYLALCLCPRKDRACPVRIQEWCVP